MFKKPLLRLVLLGGALIFGIQTSLAQLEVYTETDKQEYSYGDSITVKVYAKNTSDENVNLLTNRRIILSFSFDTVGISSSPVYHPSESMYAFKPQDSVGKTWTIHPEQLGLPNSDGTHSIIGYTHYKNTTDTAKIEAPAYVGGELFVHYADSATAEDKQALRDSLGVTVLENDYWYFSGYELWKTDDYMIDTLRKKLMADWRIVVARANRFLEPKDEHFDLNLWTGIDDSEVPEKLSISQAWPNPFNPRASFTVSTQQAQPVSILLYNTNGRKVRTLHRGYLTAGKEHRFTIDGAGLPSGTYIIRARAGGSEYIRKATLVK